MDLKRLRAFVTVVDQGSVSRAAHALHLTQPALSRQISALEHELGLALFERVGRRLQLTVHGEQLVDDCRALLTQADGLSAQAAVMRSGEFREVRVAASPLTIETVLPDFLRGYRDLFPERELKLIDAEASSHLDLLERGAAQLAVGVLDVLELDEARFAASPLHAFELLAAFQKGAGPAPGRAVEIKDVAHQPLLLLDPSYATRAVFDAACRLAHARPRIFLESSTSHALLALAEAGHGIAIVPSIVRTDPRRLATQRITHRGEPLHLTLGVLWDKRRTKAAFASAFSEVLTEHLRTRRRSSNPPGRPSAGAPGNRQRGARRS